MDLLEKQYEDENYETSEDDDFESENDFQMEDPQSPFLTEEGNYNDTILKAQAKNIAAVKELEKNIKAAPLFQTTKQALIQKLHTYTDPTNVLAILPDIKDPMRHFEIDMTTTISGFPPHDVEQEDLQNLVRSLRHLYEMFLTRAVNGLERDKQSIIEHRSQNRVVMERKNGMIRPVQPKRWAPWRRN